ncbi:hypothetical protein GW891_04185 [bacterium]|nr:hypothetical protein [bacterium]
MLQTSISSSSKSGDFIYCFKYAGIGIINCSVEIFTHHGTFIHLSHFQSGLS